MKKMYFISLFLLFAVSFTAVAQEQIPQPPDWIRQFDGIPIEAGIHWDWVTNNPDAVDSMRMAGVDILHLSIEDQEQMDILSSWDDTTGFQALVFKSPGGPTGSYNYIQHYTNAKYSVWEAEVTSSPDTTIYHKDSVMKDTSSGGIAYLKLKHTAAALQDTALIWGPYYKQDVKYYASQDGTCDTIDYRADFRLMIEDNPYYPPIEDNPNDTICIIQVTQTYAYIDNGWKLGCTYVIAEKAITLGDFEELNQFYNFTFDDDYRLRYDSCQYASPDEPSLSRTVISDAGCPGPVLMRSYIEFKVRWMGKQQYLLSIDNITVSDIRGRELINPASDARDNIEAQDNSLSTYHDFVSGWIGIDEPRSIDSYEPIKIVKDILDDHSNGGERPLWIPLAGTWDGAYENSGNPFGIMHINPIKDIKNRIGSANIIHNSYLFDIPCSENSPPENTACWTGEDQRVINITRHTNLNYKYIYELDPYWGLSLQCGAIKPQYGITSWQRNISSHEFLYSANLALMYGAKFLSLYTYFAQSPTYDSLSGLTYHGIVDYDDVITDEDYTDKYYTLRDTLSPRLKGLFGKTIKNLIPVNQFAGSDGINYNPSQPPESIPSGFLYIEDIYPSTIPQYGPYGLDIGFFSDPNDNNKKYFLVLNRYYSSREEYYIKLKDLFLYKNWEITNYIDTASYTVQAINNRVTLFDTLLIGDAKLYSVLPVVKYGGSLIYNETITGTQSLNDVMTIDNGAVLTVDGTYNCEADIIIKDGSIVTTNAGIINFTNGSKLIIEGSAYVNGTSLNNLTLNFISPTNENGIVVTETGAFTITYCNISNAETGN